MTVLPILNQFFVLIVVFIRMTGLVLAAPVLSHRAVPMQVRILLALALAILVTPIVTTPLPELGSVLDLAGLVVSELAIGFVLGLGIMILVEGLQLAGEIVARMAGLGIGAEYDPSSESEISSFSQLLLVAGLVTFLCVGGERALLGGILESYRVLKPGAALSVHDSAGLLLDCVTVSFVLAIRVAAPAMAALLTMTLVLGLISRTLPQLNLLMLGFGLNALAALGTLLFSMGFIIAIFDQELSNSLQKVFPWIVGQ